MEEEANEAEGVIISKKSELRQEIEALLEKKGTGFGEEDLRDQPGERRGPLLR